MNKEIEKANSRCIICGQDFDKSSDLIIETFVDDTSSFYAHEICAIGLSRILEQIGHQKPQTTQLQSLIRNIDGKQILTRRDFPNQYAPILLFYGLCPDTPTTLLKLKEWITLNDLDFSNPNVPVKRLVKNGMLSVIVGADKESRYFITETGLEELEKYVRKMVEK